MKKIVSGFLAASMMFAATAGLAGSALADEASEFQTTYGEKQFDGVTIQVELWDRENAPAGSTITENRWTKYVQDEMGKVGINVEFVPVPRGEEIDKMTSMMAGGIAPDIVLTYTYSRARDYFDQGGVWDLAPFVDGEDQALNLKQYLGKDVLEMGRLESGELYGIIAKRINPGRGNFYVRKDWMEALGLEIPKTPDELYDFIEKMTKENPEGRTDVIGTSTWDDGYFLSAFSKLASDPVQSLISCKLTRDYADEGVKEYWRFKNKLFNNGLLHPEYYLVSSDDFTSYIVNGTFATFEDHINANIDGRHGYALKALQENFPEADYVSIPPLENIYDGKQYSTIYSQGGLIAFCPKTADEETVEACITYLDWLCTPEGGGVVFHGFEGEHYNLEDGVPIVIDSAYNTADKDWIRGDLFLTGNGGYYMNREDFIKSAVHDYAGYEDHAQMNFEYALMGDFINDIDDSLYTSPAESELAADINLVKDEYLVKIVTCPADEFDETYEAYREALKDAGVEEIIEQRTAFFAGE